MSRSYAELLGLEMEAERLVRSGESRAEVSRRLGVHVSTLSQWALKGGWRRKDIELERSGEATRRTLHAIRDGNRAVDAQAALRAELAVVMRAAVRLLAEGGAGAAGIRSLARAAPSVSRAAHAIHLPQSSTGAGLLLAASSARLWRAAPSVSLTSSAIHLPRLAAVEDFAEDARMTIPPTIVRWHRIALENLPEELAGILADDAVFESPVVHTPQVGKAIVEKYLRGALQVLNTEHFRYGEEWFSEQSQPCWSSSARSTGSGSTGSTSSTGTTPG